MSGLSVKPETSRIKVRIVTAKLTCLVQYGTSRSTPIILIYSEDLRFEQHYKPFPYKLLIVGFFFLWR